MRRRRDPGAPRTCASFKIYRIRGTMPAYLDYSLLSTDHVKAMHPCRAEPSPIDPVSSVFVLSWPQWED